MVFYPEENRSIPSVDLLSWLFTNNETPDDKDIFIDASDDAKRINKREALSMIRRLIAGLTSVGFAPEDTLCLHAFNHYLYSIFYLATVGAGGRFVGSNPAYTTPELQHLLNTTHPKYFIVESHLLDKLLPALLSKGTPASHIFILETDDLPDNSLGFKSWESLLHYGERDWLRFDDRSVAQSTPAALLLTSGTTGLPKAAAISHYAHVAAAIAMQASNTKPYTVRRLISVPQLHAFAAPLAHISPLKWGHTTYVMRRFEPSKFTTYVHRYKISETAVVPPIVASLVSNSRDEKPLPLSSLRLIWCAGSSLPQTLNDRMYRILHEDAIIAQVWGMTELGWASTFQWPERDMAGSVGKLLPNVEARVVDDRGLELYEEGTCGEIQIRSPSAMNGYLMNSQATEEAYDDGWLRTGDIGYFKERKIYLIDRKKELIKVRGWQVSPSELECTLLLHPSVLDVAVVPVQVATGYGNEELPRAYVVLHSAAQGPVAAREIKEFMDSRLARYKSLDGGIVFVSSIPRNGSGKILHKVLSAAVVEPSDELNRKEASSVNAAVQVVPVQA